MSASKTLFFSTAATGMLLASAAAEQTGNEPALEILKKINQNPAIAHSLEARNDALLTTGSIVKAADGVDRVLYHLPASEQGMRLIGESASKTWPVQIAQQQLEDKVTLRVAYMNAVSVMPEASHLAVEINGVIVGKSPIQSPDRSKAVSFRVPNHILVPGYNSVRIFARQRHRVDCSINATHELWTDIDASKTGFVFGRGNSALNSLDSISALARNKAGQVRMRLLTPESREAAQIEKSMLLAQHAAVYADFDQAHVDVASVQGQGPGLDIFAGTMSELRAVAPQYAKAAKNTAGLQILSRDGDERLALILINTGVAVDHDQFSKQLKSMFPRKAVRGSAQGIATAKLLRSKGIAEGKKVRFSELGVMSEEFDGRLFRRSFQVNLPSDYFAADYDQAEMHLATAYSAGLNSNNKFIIRVNGVTATGFSLGKADGHVFKNKMLRLPLSAFKPGSNSVEVEAQLAKEGESKCAAAAQISDAKRFVISGNSTIRFPRLAHLARLPDLAGTVTAGFPYVIAGKPQPTVISVPGANLSELTAAAGFATQIAIKAGVPLDFSLQYGPPPNDAKNAIVVGSFSQLPSRIATSIKGIDQAAFQTSWMSNNPLQMQRNVASNASYQAVDTITTAGIASEKSDFKTHAAVANPSLEVTVPQPEVDPLDRWGEGAQTSSARNDESLNFSDQVKELVYSVFSGTNKSINKTPVITNPNSDILLSQRISPSDERGVWTVLTARSNEALKTSVALLAKPGIVSRINGETVTVNGVDRTVTSSVAAQNYVQVRGFSLRNMHLIVAGWFSNNHLIYSLLLLSTLLGIGLVSTRVLKSVGVKTDDEGSGGSV